MNIRVGDLVCFKDEWGNHNEREVRILPTLSDRDKGHYRIYNYVNDKWIVVPSREGIDPVVGRHTFDYFLVIQTHPTKKKFHTNFISLLFPDGSVILVNADDLDEERTIHANSEEELVQETG